MGLTPFNESVQMHSSAILGMVQVVRFKPRLLKWQSESFLKMYMAEYYGTI